MKPATSPTKRCNKAGVDLEAVTDPKDQQLLYD